MFGLGKLFKRKDPTLEDVGRALLPQLEALRPGGGFSFDVGLGVIRGAKGDLINLSNLHLDYVRTAPDQRAQMLRGFATGVLQAQMPASFEEARDSLLPALRSLSGLDQARILGGAGSLELLASGMQPFSETLMVGVVRDSEHAMQQVTGQAMQDWGVSPEQLHQVAIDNLRHKAAPAFGVIAPGLYASSYGDFYDAARILLPELAWQLNLPGTPVAMVPNRICLLLAGDQDGPALRAMVQKSREILENEPRPLAAEMFRLNEGRWQPWMPADAEAARLLLQLQAQQHAADCAAQKQVLDEMHRKSGLDVFVASNTLVRRADGSLVSYCVLSKDVVTWLPRTDVVILLDPAKPDAPKKIVNWASFEEQAAHLIEVLPFVPPRYHVKEHPSEALIAALPERVL
jgi:hypothetical protein